MVKGGLTGCGLHGHSLVSVLFLACQSNMAGCLYVKHFYSCFKLFVSCFGILYCGVEVEAYIIVEQWKRSGGIYTSSIAV